MARCPHVDIRHCPLYHGMHAAGPSCFDGRLDEGGCAVKRGASYEGLLLALRIHNPLLVAECEWNADKDARNGFARVMH